MYCTWRENGHAVCLFSMTKLFRFYIARGLGGFSTYEQFLQISIHGKFVKKVPMDVHRQCLLYLSIILDKNSYPDFFGIMTSYQECCIYAVSLKKGRDNMEYFLLNSDFFKRYNSGKKSG